MKTISTIVRKLSGWVSFSRHRFPQKGRDEDVLCYPECSMTFSKAQGLKDLMDRLDRCIETRKLYLDPFISLSQVAKIVGSNRTYISNVLASRKGYKYYMNEFRLKHIAIRLEAADSERKPYLLSEDEELYVPGKLSAIVLTSGFTDMRTFRRALSASESIWAQKIRGKIY